MPFIPTAGTEEYEDQNRKDQLLLHHLERSSILISMIVVWSATVFILYRDSVGATCESAGCRSLVLADFVLNVGFLIFGIGLFMHYFAKRNRLLGQLVSRMRRSFGNVEMASNAQRREPRSNVNMDEPEIGFTINPLSQNALDSNSL